MTRMHHAEASPVAARNGDRGVAAWLLACCALVFAMVVVGGVTRLTHSGLSSSNGSRSSVLCRRSTTPDGRKPSEVQTDPEYRLVNPHMTLEGFKNIFWWEYVHRLLGRLIGAAFLLRSCGSRCEEKSPSG